MRISIHDRQQLMSSASLLEAEAKLAAGLSRFGYRILGVELRVQDQNGPRGGIDKVCRVVVKLHKMGEVVATAEDPSLHKAITRTIGRVERAVARRVEKRNLPHRDRHSGFGLALYN